MDDSIREQAELAARLLLHHFQEQHPEWSDDRTPLDEIVSWLGLHVTTFYPGDYAPGTYGFIDSDEDEGLIWLSRNLSETFRRFTLAHELGHAILHCNGGSRLQALLADRPISLQEQQGLPELSRADPCHGLDIQEGTTGFLDQEQLQEMLGIGHTYDPRSQREVAANLFAAELLMPLERIRTLYLVQCIPAYTLVDRFGVSQAAVLTRLARVTRPTKGMIADKKESLPGPSPRKHYDEFQQAAIESPTPALITAGPGSGKTSTLIGRIEYMIQTIGIAPEHILALTFSRKAAQEMEERLFAVLNNGNDNTPTLPKVSTFHAFCADILRQYGTLVGLRTDFGLIDEPEGYFLLRQQAQTLRLKHYQNLHAPDYYFPDLLKAISRAKDELVSPQAYVDLARRMREQARDEEALQKAEKALEVAHVYRLYEEALHRRGDTDFGGLIVLTVQLLRQHLDILHQLQERYQHILVDEFQDMNRASGVLLRELAGEARRVWVVGDANQAIYAFRGASPANMSNFEQDFPGAVVLPLSRNYRSRPDLVKIAEAFRCIQLELGQEPGKNVPIRLTQPDTYVTLAKATNDTGEVQGIIHDIHSKHTSGYAYKDMVILCRTRAQAQKISRTLADAGLPIIERGSIFEQEHIKDILSIVLLLTDPSGMGLLRASRRHEHLVTQTDLEAFLLTAREQNTYPGLLLLRGEIPHTVSTSGRQALTRLAAMLQSLQYAPDTWSFLAQYLFMETSLVRDLVSSTANKQRTTLLADYDALLQLARQYDQQQRNHALLASSNNEAADQSPLQPALVQQLKGFLEYLSLRVMLRQDGANRQQAAENGEEDSPDVIRVMTVHASKGLEFPIVYMPGLVQHRFPSLARSSPIPAPTGMLPPESEGSAAHESGESCLFYVGVTRARDFLVLSYSERYGKRKYKRSLYLDALEAGLTNDRITKLQWEGSDNESGLGKRDTSVPNGQPSEDFIQAMKPPTLHISAIEAYQRCPRQYAYSAIYGFQGEEGAYRLFWRATQKTVEKLRQQIQEQDANAEQHAPTAQEIQDLYSKHWQEMGGQNMPFAALYEQHGQEVVELVRRTLTTQREVSWDLWAGYSVEIAGKTVHVTVDRVEAAMHMASTPVKFVRTRFGKRKDKPTAEARELLYARAYRQLHPGQSVELHSHNLSTGEVVPISLSAKKEQSLYEEVEQSVLGLERNEYPAAPAEPFRCPGCPFFWICPA